MSTALASNPAKSPHAPPRGYLVGPPRQRLDEGEATDPGQVSGRNNFRAGAWGNDAEPSQRHDGQTAEEYHDYVMAWRRFRCLVALARREGFGMRA